jgi:hypothetical protein
MIKDRGGNDKNSNNNNTTALLEVVSWGEKIGSVVRRAKYQMKLRHISTGLRQIVESK